MDHEQRPSPPIHPGVHPGWIVAGGATYWAFFALLVLGVDGHDLFGWGTWLSLDETWGFGALWPRAFGEAGPVEWAQWGALAATSVLAAVSAGWHGHAGRTGGGEVRDQRSPGPANRFWFLFAAGVAVMLIEDAGNVRHDLQDITQGVAPALGETGGLVAQLGFFALLAGFLGYALLRYWRVPWSLVLTRSFMLAGVALYAVAVISSAFGQATDWYFTAGSSLGEGPLAWLPQPPHWDREQLHFYVMDHAVEETLELFAATFLLAAVVAWRRGR
jgi:hypothetical protein